MRKLDSLDELQDIKISGIKLDVENFEYFALKGGQKILIRDRPIVYTELWENDNRQKCFDFMTQLGYAIKIHEGGELIPYLPNEHSTQNFFLIPL